MVRSRSQSRSGLNFRSQMITILLLLVFSTTALIACVALPSEPPTTTTTIALPATSATNTQELQSELDSTGRLYINSAITSNGTLRPPSGSIIQFGPSGLLVRDLTSTGSGIDVSLPNVTIYNLRVKGSDPCYWTNTSSPNPYAIGEMYSQYDSKREEQAALYVHPGADGLKVYGLFANDVWGDGLTIVGGSNLRFNNVNVRCAGRTGISNVNSSNVVVDGGSVSGTLLWGLNIEPTGSTRSVSDYSVKNFSIGYTTNQWLYVGGPGFNCNVFRVDLRGVTLLPAASHTPYVAPCAVSNLSF